MSVSSKPNAWQWIIPFVLLFCSWTFIGGWFTIFARYWIWLIVGMISLLFLVPRFFTTKAFFALIAYSLVVVLNFMTGDQYYRSVEYVLVDITQFVFFGGVGYYLLHHKSEERISKTILYLELFVIVFSSIGTYLVDLQIPNICRMTVGYLNTGVSCDPYYRMGVCKYDMPHALPIMIPPLVLWLKQKQTKRGFKWLAVIVLFFIMLLIWTSAATTPLLLAVIALVLSFVIKPSYNNNSNLRRFVIVLLLASPLTMPSVQLGIIHGLDRIIPEDNNNKQKLQSFEDRIIYGKEEGGDLKGREDLYQMSIETFLKNPIIGTNNLNEIGEHSIFLDRMAVLGIVGFVPFLLFFWFYFKDSYYYIPPSFRFYYLIGLVCFLLMFALKNMPENWMHLAVFVMLPIMIDYDTQ